MSGLQKQFQSIAYTPSIDFAPEESKWYAVQTMARHEKKVSLQLLGKNIFTFLPLIQQIHQWSDRQSKVEVPLFSCYTFVRIVPTAENWVRVVRTEGVLGFVGARGQGTSIPEEQIESLRTAMKEKIPCRTHPFIKNGDRVRIRGGSLDGIEGILKQQGADRCLVVSVELLQRSISIRVNGYDIELI